MAEIVVVDAEFNDLSGGKPDLLQIALQADPFEVFVKVAGMGDPDLVHHASKQNFRAVGHPFCESGHRFRCFFGVIWNYSK